MLSAGVWQIEFRNNLSFEADNQGQVVLHRNFNADPESLRRALQPFREDLIIGVVCMFSWYWLCGTRLTFGLVLRRMTDQCA